MKDEKYIKEFAEKFNLDLKVYTEKNFIADQAIECEAVKSICLLSKTKQGIVDFAINKDGKCIGYFTDQRNSFVKV